MSTSGLGVGRFGCRSGELLGGVAECESFGSVDCDNGEPAMLLMEPPVFARGRLDNGRDFGMLEELDVRDMGGAEAGV